MQVLKKFRQCYKKPHNLGKVPHVTELWRGTGRTWGIPTVLMLIQ